MKDTLTSRERVLRALRHQEVDRAPRGELLIAEGFLDRMDPETRGRPSAERTRRFMEAAGLDLLVLPFTGEGLGEQERALLAFGRATSRFIVVLLDGLFWGQGDALPWDAFIVGLHLGEEVVLAGIEEKRRRILSSLERSAPEAPDAILIADDLAFDGGLFEPLQILEARLFPAYREIVEGAHRRGMGAFFHCCGRLDGLPEALQDLGWDAIHGLAGSSGNALPDLRRRTAGRMTLMGGAEPDRWSKEEILAFTEKTVPLLLDPGGYVLGSSGGLWEGCPPDAVKALYGML